MWAYKSVSREYFEKRKDFVDTILRNLGCNIANIQMPYEQKTTMHTADFTETFISKRLLYQYKTCYFRIDEVLFPEKPFIVLEFANTIEEVLNNIMEDADPFPYDLTDDEIVQEVKYSLKIDPYPQLSVMQNQPKTKIINIRLV